ncbi:Plug domain-containing protein [Sphingobium terrigena]|uniref:Plug domain-containing protein n=1 Tax=Sphingobium terrigena TaxID=2304063 RepID=A0A418YXG7_9SPHN|nr:Plug domain-containing protein [Sphingobium terrigena]
MMNVGSRPAILTALITTHLAGFATPTLAQETPEANGELSLADIIVSARRRNETIQQTPIAMTALAPSALEAKATMNIGDLLGAAPNVLITAQSTGAGTANTSIRGLAFADVEKSFDPTIAIVVDGVFIGTGTGQFLDFFDTESIEVLRGPQGTLFGRNTIGGVINIQRTRPTGRGCWTPAPRSALTSMATRRKLPCSAATLPMIAVLRRPSRSPASGPLPRRANRESMASSSATNFDATTGADAPANPTS